MDDEPAKTQDDLLPRHLERELVEALASSRVVNIVGPRQAGKTTLVRDLFSGGRFLTLDDTNALDAIERDPDGQLELLTREAGDAPLIIDEAQRSRGLALAIKKIVDARRRMGQFILTGSSNIFTTLDVADSLAGRVTTLTMLPLSMAEVHAVEPAPLLDWASGRLDGGSEPNLTSLPIPPTCSRRAYIDLMIRGGYPEMRRLDDRRRSRRLRSTIDTIVDRDVADILRIRKTDAMRRLIDQVAVRTGQELNVAEVCNLIGVNRATTEQYLDVLTRLTLIVRLGAWASGEGRREVRHPKTHVDTGVVAALRNLNAESFGAQQMPEALGGVMESFVHGELSKNLPYQSDVWRLYHWRRDQGREIDVIAEAGRRLVLVEVKASSTVGEGDFRHLRWFRREGPGKSWETTGIVVYLGEHALTFGDGMFALPLSAFWSFEKPSGPRARVSGPGRRTARSAPR